MLSQSKKTRSRRGALTAEWAMTLYVLFLFIAIPMLDFAVLGARAFFLWFACNQAVMGGSKGHTLVNPVTIGGNTFQGGLSIAFTRALQVQNAFPGIHWNPSKYPEVYIRFVPISAKGAANPISPVGPITYVSGTTVSPVKSVPDSNDYLCEFDVDIIGTLDPLIPVPMLFGTVPGLSGPMTMRVESTAQFENPPGLVQ